MLGLIIIVDDVWFKLILVYEIKCWLFWVFRDVFEFEEDGCKIICVIDFFFKKFKGDMMF